MLAGRPEARRATVPAIGTQGSPAGTAAAPGCGMRCRTRVVTIGPSEKESRYGGVKRDGGEGVGMRTCVRDLAGLSLQPVQRALSTGNLQLIEPRPPSCPR